MSNKENDYIFDEEMPVVGEQPADLHVIPGVQHIDNNPLARGLFEKGVTFVQDNKLIEFAQKTGRSILAENYGEGKRLVFLAAGAAALIAATAAVVIYRHQKHEAEIPPPSDPDQKS